MASGPFLRNPSKAGGYNEGGEKARCLDRYRQLLLLELSEKAPPVTGVTTNHTEQFIGRGFKIRVKGMRGFKRANHQLRFLHLVLVVDGLSVKAFSISSKPPLITGEGSLVFPTSLIGTVTGRRVYFNLVGEPCKKEG